jgi:hypothetical protein
MKAYWWSGGITPFILNLGTRLFICKLFNNVALLLGYVAAIEMGWGMWCLGKGGSQWRFQLRGMDVCSGFSMLTCDSGGLKTTWSYMNGV